MPGAYVLTSRYTDRDVLLTVMKEAIKEEIKALQKPRYVMAGLKKRFWIW